MGDRDENYEEIHEEGHERHINPRRSVRDCPLNFQGEQHQLPTLSQGTLPVFLGDGAVDPKRHMNLFLDMCDFHLIEYDDVMVISFIQTLIGQAYEWYTSLPTRSIRSFDDLETMFLNMYAPSWHTILFSRSLLKYV
jgi:hypothetical protein